MRVHPDERKKKHHAKSRLGCLSCKRRHLKCDEARPSCARCVHDFGRCEGYDTPKVWIFEPSSHEPAAIVIDPSSDSSPSSGSAPSSSREQCSSSSSQSSTSPSDHQANPTSENGNRRQKRWAPKSKSGCTTCKKRRVKCDQGRPACLRCTSSNRECEYAAPPSEGPLNATDPPQIAHSRSSTGVSPHQPPTIMYINHTPYKTQTEYQTFVHWQSRTESCMVISRSFGNFNILGDTMPKAAWSYDCLKHGLLSAASVTASIEKFSLGEFNERQAVVEAVKQSSLAISSIFDEKPPPEVTVLVAFVFWFMEAWLGSWSRAVMHLASAARICEQGYPKGEVSEGVAWYVGICDAGVPQALRTPQILKLAQNRHDGFDENFYVRLLWGFREAVAGISLLQGARLKARQVRPDDYGQFDAILATHQAQMEFLSGRWLRHAQSQPTSVQLEQDMPPPPAVPMYSKVMDMVNHFLNNDDGYDPLILAIYLKMVQRSLPLFVAGKNMEIRRDAALSIPIKARPLELESQQPQVKPQSTTAIVS